MFLIANSCGREITISDLGVTLYARQAVDLHKIETLINPENSKDLKSAMHYGAVKILHKEQAKPIITEREVIVKEAFDKEDLLKDIKSILSQEIDKKINISQNSNNSQQMAEVLAMMQKIVENNQNVSVPKNETSFDVDVNENTLIDLHSRSLNKMSKNVVDGELRGNEEVKKDALLDNVDELSNML